MKSKLITKRRPPATASVGGFTVYKFTDRPKPGPENVLIVCAFSEFGCETLGVMYCLPEIKAENPDKYLVVAGWWGRSYLYRHLADEFWELGEDAQPLRDSCTAFQHSAPELAKIEKRLADYGAVIPTASLGNRVVGSRCPRCGRYWGTTNICRICGEAPLAPSLFSSPESWRSVMTPVPRPSESKLAEARKYLGPWPVGVFARGRVTYGRNLPPEFYVSLVGCLEAMGYTPVWLGEKQSTIPCPCPHIVDFSRTPESRDLELTLAIVSQCEFTVQFWTASTRLAGMVGTPFLLFESPDQIFGEGQEGIRISMTSAGNRKIVLAHYLNVFRDQPSALRLFARAVREMEAGDWSDVLGMVEEESVVRAMMASKSPKMAWGNKS